MSNQNHLAEELENLRLPELRQRFFEVIGEETRCPNRTFLIRRIEQALRERGDQASSQDEEPRALVPQPAEAPEGQVAGPVADAEQPRAEDAVAEAASMPAVPDAEGGPETVAEQRAESAQPQGRRRGGRANRAVRRSERGRFKDMTVEELQALYLQKVGRATGSSDKAYLIWKIREAEKGRIPIGPRETRSPEQQGASDVRILPLRLEAQAVEQMDAAWRERGMKTRMEFFRRALGHYLEHIGAEEAAALFGS